MRSLCSKITFEIDENLDLKTQNFNTSIHFHDEYLKNEISRS